jgi:membrane protein DedA with SNARE-associated domain
MIESLQYINQWLDFLFSYGAIWVYLVIGLACFIENIFPPFPGDSFIVAAGSLVALDRLSPVGAMLTVNIGGLTSVMILFLIGRRFGRDFFIRKNYKYFSAKDIEVSEQRMARWGGGILVASRFVVGFRVAIAIVAGLSRYNPGKMFLFTAISYVAFTCLLMYFGYSLVDNLELIDEIFTEYNRIVWPILGVIVLLWIYRRYKNSRKKADG